MSKPVKAFAFVHDGNNIDPDDIASTVEALRDKCIRESLGWRYEHEDQYDHEKEWQRQLKYGKVVPVVITIQQ